jgi:aminocarboxymuconate-semialdehyde decarboxylase
MKIDIFNHVIPPTYLESMQRMGADPGLVKRMSSIRMLSDAGARAEMLDQWPDVQQVLTLAVVAPEMIAGPEGAAELARLANDGLANICGRWPQKYPAFVATLPMNNVPAALKEMDRAIGDLGAVGVQVMTNINGRPLDDPEFFSVFERVTNHYGRAVWMHPVRTAHAADYPVEATSMFEVWQVLGWPYETSVAMARLVFSGLLDKLPDLRIVTHHCGGMIPYFAGRAETMWSQLGSRTEGNAYAEVRERLAKTPLLEYFRRFYGDTVLGGATAPLRCGLDFFGSDHVVFASDCPFDPEGGPMFIRGGIRSIEELGLSEADKELIYHGNAERLLHPVKRAR